MDLPEEYAGGGIGAERRAGERVRVMIRPAKLIAGGREFLCVVRDVSHGGVKLRLFHDLPEYRHLTIEFDTGDRYRLQLAWHAGEIIGCSFLDEVDVSQLVAAHHGPYPRRQPRLRVELEAILYAGGVRSAIAIRDISQRGASFDCPALLKIDELVRIECAVLPTLHAKVRWRRPPRFGVVLEHVFQLEDLAKLCGPTLSQVELFRPVSDRPCST